MSSNQDAQNIIRGYLLGQLDDAAREEFEQRLLTDDDAYAELLAVEDEMVDAYLRNDLDADEMKRFAQNLTTPTGQQKLRFAKAFERYAATHPPEASSVDLKTSRRTWAWPQLFSHSYLRAAAFAVVLLVAALGVWRIFIFQSDVDKGLLALNAAYREQRPVEARITRLDYAPFITTRGAPPKFNSIELSHAELLLLEAVTKNPSAASHHALGQLYLSKKLLDEAIEQFELALKSDPNNAQIHADLGAAYLEKGKLGLERAKPGEANSEAGKGMQDLARSLDNLNKALVLKPDLLDALFNRALCHQYMTLYDAAEEDWRNYLKKDSSSRWAGEAQQNLNSLEARRKRTSDSEEQLRQQFFTAFDSRNDNQAWIALSRTQRREGNLIVEKLLDEYLKLSIGGQLVDADRALQLIVYAGDVQANKGDRYTSDLVKVYAKGGKQRLQSLAAARDQMKTARASFGNNEFDEAIRLFTLAEASFTTIPDVPEALFAHSWIGHSSVRISKTADSIQIFQDLAGKFEQRGYKFFQALAWVALGDAYSNSSEFSKTLAYAIRGLEASERVEDTGTSLRCLAQRVSMYLILNDTDKSLDSFVRATVLAEKIPSEPKLLWPLYYEAALDFHVLNLPSASLAFAKKAMDLANAANVPVLKSRSLERLGAIYGEQGNFAAGIDSGVRALAEAQYITGEQSRKALTAHSTLVLGELYANAGDPKKAIDYFDQSIAINADLKLEAYSYRAHKGKLLVLISLHDDTTAQAELETVIRTFESHRKKIVEASNRDKFFDKGQDTYDVAIDFAISRRSDYQKALEYAEASRARSLFEMMGSGIRPVSGPDGRDLELSAETTPLTAYQIQKELPANVQLLEYAVLSDRVVMWVVTPSAINTAQVPIEAQDLEASVRRFVSLLSAGGEQSLVSDQIRAEGNKLYKTLIAPVEGLLDPSSEICIVADKSLHFLPFSALVNPSGRYLIEDFRIQQSPSAAIFVRSSATATEKAKSTEEALLSVGNPDFNKHEFSSLADLPAAAREAKEVAALYDSRLVLTGAEASRDRVIHGSAQADVIHFATHAIADMDSPLSSKLLLASDHNAPEGSIENRGALEVYDIYGLKLARARLVVLSACQTGIERSYKGEGAVGLARPFIAAGVPLVIASLWPVESNATADLMISFHRYRKLKKLPTASALRMAQLDLIQQQQSHSQSNYGWAAFSLIGGNAIY